MKIHVLTVSVDDADKGLIGPHVQKILEHHFPDSSVTLSDISCDGNQLTDAYAEHADFDLILTAGGCGILKNEIVPDVTSEYCERIIPGIPEMLRIEAYKLSPYSVFSRGTAGIKNKTLIVNIPGSLKAALLYIRLLIPVIHQSVKLLNGQGKDGFELVSR